jgi:hypothetical protein
MAGKHQMLELHFHLCLGFFWWGLGEEVAGATPPVHFVLVILEMGGVFKLDPQNLSLPWS